MSAIQIAGLSFPHHTYDADADVLYLGTTVPPIAIVDGDETPEGHFVGYDHRGIIVGLTIVGPRHTVEAGEPLVVTVPQPATVAPDDLALALGD